MPLEAIDDREALKKKKAELKKRLKEKQRRQGITPLNHVLEHKKQLELTMRDEPSRWFFGGNRTGKTEWGAHEVARFLHKRHPVKAIMDSFGDDPVEVWSACPSYDVQEDTTQKKIMALLDPGRIVGKPVKIRGDIISSLKYRADDGSISKLTFKSYDQGREKFQGAGKNLVWFDEECPRSIHEECTIRYEAGEGKRLFVIGTMTPVNGMTWVYDEIYLNTSNENIYVVTATWDDNIFLTEDQRQEMRSRFTPGALQVREKGLFINRTGLVCDWFQRGIHMVPDLASKVPKGCDIYRGIDFGFAKPAAIIYIAVDTDGTEYHYDGIYRKGMTNTDIARQMVRKEQGINVKQCWGDSANASDIEELNQMTEIDGKKVNFNVIPVKKATGTSTENWDEYRAKLLSELGRINPVSGKPMVYMSEDLMWFNHITEKEENFALVELENLRWDEVRRDGEKVQRSRWEDKCAQHYIDAWTYVSHSYRDPPETNKEKQPEHIDNDDWVA
jgi:phage terminase large subunit-like protein